MRWLAVFIIAVAGGCTVIGDDVVRDGLCPWQQDNQAILDAGLLPRCEDGVKALIAYEASARRLDAFLASIRAACPDDGQ